MKAGLGFDQAAHLPLSRRMQIWSGGIRFGISFTDLIIPNQV